MKILILSHAFSPSIGGIEVNSEILAQEFKNAGNEVHVVTWSTDSQRKHFPYSIVRSPTKYELIKEHLWADVIFENNPCLRLAWPNIFFNKPSVIALNTWVSRVDGTIGVLDRLKLVWLKRARGVIAVSEAVRKRCWPKAIVIGNPYRKSLFKVMPEVQRIKGFVFLGRLVSDKGADLAVQAISKIIASAFDGLPFKPSLTIVGDGEEKGRLRRLVSELGVEDYVHFKEALCGEALSYCLNEHRYILVPSVWEEPFGNVALEGIACGCIPIVADGGGLPDAIGKAGVTFTRGSVDSLVASIISIIKNAELERELREQGAMHLRKHQPEKVAKKYLEVIEMALLK